MKRFDINDVVLVEHEGRPILKGSVNKVSCKPVMVEGTEVCPFNLLNGQLQTRPPSCCSFLPSLLSWYDAQRERSKPY